MLDLVQMLDACRGLLPLVKIIVSVIRLIMILIPIALIVYGVIDLGKAVIASDEKEVKAAQSRLIKRFIYAALVFFVPMLVGVFMSLVADSEQDGVDTVNAGNCWRQAGGWGWR